MERRSSSESVIREIRRKTRKKYSSEEKIRIVLEGMCGEESISAICRKEGLNPTLYYRWSKDFLEAGKKRLTGDTIREVNSSEVSNRKDGDHPPCGSVTTIRKGNPPGARCQPQYFLRVVSLISGIWL